MLFGENDYNTNKTDKLSILEVCPFYLSDSNKASALSKSLPC